MSDYGSWEESRGRIEDRLKRNEETMKAILQNGVWLLRLLVGAILGLAGHAVLSYLQIAAKH